jgi:hypothetical protein
MALLLSSSIDSSFDSSQVWNSLFHWFLIYVHFCFTFIRLSVT